MSDNEMDVDVPVVNKEKGKEDTRDDNLPW